MEDSACEIDSRFHGEKVGVLDTHGATPLVLRLEHRKMAWIGFDADDPWQPNVPSFTPTHDAVDEFARSAAGVEDSALRFGGARSEEKLYHPIDRFARRGNKTLHCRLYPVSQGARTADCQLWAETTVLAGHCSHGRQGPAMTVGSTCRRAQPAVAGAAFQLRADGRISPVRTWFSFEDCQSV